MEIYCRNKLLARGIFVFIKIMIIIKGLFMKNAPHKKLQSAMEYLMTYGWAILIIAVVIGVLYALGIFNGAGLLGSFCTAQTGYFCANPILSTNSPTLNVTIGQDTRLEWSAWKIFAVRGTAFNASSPNITGSGAFYNGEKQIVTIPLNSILGNYIPIGTPFSGSLWAEYCNTPNCNTPDQVSEIGIFSTKAAKLGYVTTSVSTSSISTTSTTSTSTTSTATTAPTTTIVPSGIIYSVPITLTNGVPPSSIPSNIVSYVPITLTNSQSSATPAPYQEMVNITETQFPSIKYGNTIANFEFFTSSGTVIPAWIESNNSGKLITWVNLPNGIPAESSITIYLGFASTSNNLLSSSGTTGIGEAPQLPCGSTATSSCSTYAEYDNGASVFSFYSDFKGNTLNTNKWATPSFGNGATAIVDNSIIISSSTTGFWMVYSVNSYAPSIVEADVTSFILNGVSGDWRLNYLGSTDNGYSEGWCNCGTNGRMFRLFTATTQIGSASSPSTGLFGLAWPNTGTENSYFNYNKIISASDSSMTYANTPISFGITLSPSSTDSTTFQYLRTRAYPPNGVMPSVTFDFPQATPAPFQQMVNISESSFSSYLTYNGNFANFEYYTLSGNTVNILPAWIESSNSGKLITWVKLPNEIPAESNTIIYLGFASTSNNLLSSSGTTGIGEAPQLPCGSTATSSCSTYAEYDDGASVFNNYWNFAGTSLPTSLSSISYQDSFNVNNGLLFLYNNLNTGYAYILTGSISQPSIIEGYTPSTNNPQTPRMGWSTTTSLGYQNTPYNSYENNFYNNGLPNPLNGVYATNGNSGFNYMTATPSITLNYGGIFSFAWLGTGSQWYSYNYQNGISSNSTVTASSYSSFYGFLGIGDYGYVPTTNIEFQWLRTRAYPPNGVMPSTAFG